MLQSRAADLRFSESVSLEAHGFELAADLALLEGAGHGSHAALQAVLHAIHLLKHLPQLTCLHNTRTATFSLFHILQPMLTQQPSNGVILPPAQQANPGWWSQL